MYESSAPAVVQLQTNDEAPAPPPTTFGGHTESLHIVTEISQRPQGTTQPSNSHIGLGLVKPVPKWSVPSSKPAKEPDSSTLLKAKPI
jgi:hypothetical protein